MFGEEYEASHFFVFLSVTFFFLVSKCSPQNLVLNLKKRYAAELKTALLCRQGILKNFDI
jgi:hypothetical protein